jgi:hypothetical protein
MGGKLLDHSTHRIVDRHAILERIMQALLADPNCRCGFGDPRITGDEEQLGSQANYRATQRAFVNAKYPTTHSSLLLFSLFAGRQTRQAGHAKFSEDLAKIDTSTFSKGGFGVTGVTGVTGVKIDRAPSFANFRRATVLIKMQRIRVSDPGARSPRLGSEQPGRLPSFFDANPLGTRKLYGITRSNQTGS